MSSKQLSSLLKKAPPATVREERPPEPDARPAPVVIQPQEGKGREVPLHVLVPAHVRKQVDIFGAQQGESLRTLVLRGLRSLGIEVSDEEIKGGHKRERRT
jgi:hypothetical protein